VTCEDGIEPVGCNDWTSWAATSFSTATAPCSWLHEHSNRRPEVDSSTTM